MVIETLGKGKQMKSVLGAESVKKGKKSKREESRGAKSVRQRRRVREE